MQRQLGRHIRAAFARVDSLPEPLLETVEDARADVNTLRDAARIVRFLDHAATLRRVGFDYETVGLSPFAPGAKLLSAAVATGTETVAFPIDHREAGWAAGERDAVWAALGRLLCSETVKIAHKAEFELLWTAAMFGRKAARATRWGCSLAQAFLLDTRPGAHSLDFLAHLLFGLHLKELSNIDVAGLADAPLDRVLRYNALDAKYCLKVFEVQEPQLAEDGLLPLYYHHMARMVALAHAQRLGLPLDAEANAELTGEYKAALGKVEKKLEALPEVQAFSASGMRFNVGSTKHVAEVLHRSGVHLDSTAEDCTGRGQVTVFQGCAGMARDQQDSQHLPDAVRPWRQAGAWRGAASRDQHLQHAHVAHLGGRAKHPELAEARRGEQDGAAAGGSA